MYNMLEELMFRMTKGPRILRRPLDEMNSLLWELCDGSRDFLEICDIMDRVFQEEIAPVKERTNAALMQFESLGFLKVLDEPFDGGWPIGPGTSPLGQKLPEADQSLELDTNVHVDCSNQVLEAE